MKNFQEYLSLKNKIQRFDTYCILEERPLKYMFGSKNYGEVIDTLNSADGDAWDVIVPGYTKLEVNKIFKIKKLEGIIEMPNGNHKLIIDVHTDVERHNQIQIKDEVYTYRRLYNRVCRKRGRIILF